VKYGQARQTAPLGSGSGLYDCPQRHEQCDQEHPGERRKRCHDEQRAPARQAPFYVRSRSQSSAPLLSGIKTRHRRLACELMSHWLPQNSVNPRSFLNSKISIHRTDFHLYMPNWLKYVQISEVSDMPCGWIELYFRTRSERIACMRRFRGGLPIFAAIHDKITRHLF
jgi:hypothetical protein